MNIIKKCRLLILNKIAIPPIICVVLILISKTYLNLEIYLFTFSIVIVLFNTTKLKNKTFLSFVVSFILCAVVFFLSLTVNSGLNYLIENLIKLDLDEIDMLRKNLPLIAKSIISPLLMFYSYRLLFKIERTNYFTVIKWISIFILVMLGLTKILYEDDYLFMSWQFIMALALQLILYQKEIKDLFSLKSPQTGARL